MSDDLVNTERVTILAGDPVRDFWLEGTVNRYPEYTFQAKVYDVSMASNRAGFQSCKCGSATVS